MRRYPPKASAVREQKLAMDAWYGRPRVDYTLVVTVPDESGRICITSPENVGLVIWAKPDLAFADVPGSVAKLRELNGERKP